MRTGNTDVLYRWMVIRAAALAVAAGLALGSGASRAAAQGATPGPGFEVETEVAQAEDLLARGQARQVVERLKPLVFANPDQPDLVRLLAKAYLADDNPFWAERTLSGALEQDPGDWQSRSWLAWVRLSEGDLDLARTTLEEVAEPAPDPGRVRFALLQALIASSAGEHGAARQALGRAALAETMFAEDRDLLRHLRRLELPGWSHPLELRTELALGHTSNSLAGSPTDPGESGGASPLARVHLFGRLLSPSMGSPRPALELMVNGLGLDQAEAEELSYLELMARPGLVVGQRRPFFVGYRAERTLMNRHPSWFSDAHRLEAELQLGGLDLFAGAGRRTFEDRSRSRDELDGGLGSSLELAGRHPLLVGVALRYAEAESPAYDQVGATALAVLRLDLGRRLWSRVSLTLSWDDYPDSGGSEGEEVFGSSERREDLLGKVALELWRDFHAISLGLRYQYGRRDSTIDASVENNYDYDEHRALLTLRWQGELDPWAPAAVRDPGHVPLDWGLAAGPGAAAAERIQELLRQDEDIRRVCGCDVGP